MKVVITGGAGFLASNLILGMLRKGYEVVAFDIAPQPEPLQNLGDRFTYVHGDMSSESELYRLIALHRPDGIMHLGAIMGGACEKNPLRAFDVNTRSLLVLLDAAVHLGVKRFFYISSIGVYAPEQPVSPVPPEGRVYPSGIYGATKAAGEFILSWYARAHGLDVRGVRPPSIWGPGRARGLSANLSLWLDALWRGEEITVDGLDEAQSWLYMEDAVDALLALWEAPSLSTRFHNLNGETFTPRVFMDTVKKILPEARIVYAETDGDMNRYQLPPVYDDSAMRQETGWSPKYSLEQALRRHLQTLEERG